MSDTPKITEAEIARLRELAEAATSGPWEVDTNAPFSRDLTGIFAPGKKRYPVLFDSNEQPSQRDAEFIAALDPQTVIALLDAVKAQTVTPAEGQTVLTVDRLSRFTGMSYSQVVEVLAAVRDASSRHEQD